MTNDSSLLQLAHSMGLHARNAYLTGLELRRTLTDFDAVGLFQNDLGYLAASGEQIIIAFAGSRESESLALDEWSGDAARLNDHTAGRVHAGLQRLMRFSIREDMLRGLEKLNTGQTILLTGHGRGGALAVLAAFELQQAGFLQVAAFTFGSPKVGDQAFAAACQFPVYRVECAGDPVTDLPADEEYAAIGELIWLAEDTNASAAPPGAEPDDSRANHAISCYLSRLQDRRITHAE